MGTFRQDLFRRGLRTGALKTAVAIAVTLAGLAGFSGSAQAQGVVRSIHQDWQIRCDTPPGAQSEQCALMQSVVSEDSVANTLTVLVLKTADTKTLVMRVIAPLGVLIPAGLGLTIDKQNVGRAGFTRCLPPGCVAEVTMEEPLLKSLRTGQNATFIIFFTPEEGVGFPLSLKGFAQGFDKLP